MARNQERGGSYAVSVRPQYLRGGGTYSRVAGQPLTDVEPAAAVSILLVAVLHLLCGISIDRCSFVLAAIRSILELATTFCTPSDRGLDPKVISSHVPTDVRTAISSLDLHPHKRSYVSCPKCFECYPSEKFPDKCTRMETPSSQPCGRALTKEDLRKGQKSRVPKRIFEYHDIRDWMSRFLNRPDIEALIDRPTNPPSDGRMRDVCDGKVMKEFVGPDGKPFISSKEEGRYSFSICMDGLNPYGNSTRGPTASVCAIYLACLNLPPSLRYRYENMCLVCVVPGPNEPSLHQINRILEPLIDDLCIFWRDGVHYRTKKYPGGRLVRIAILPLVCDLPAARQMAGMAGHSSRSFCSHCAATLDDLDDSPVKFPPRNPADQAELAATWRDALTEAAQDSIWTLHGVRWTELRRLPYWDPTRFTALDSMHLLYLGVLRRHCMDVWGMNDSSEDGPGITCDQLIKDNPSEEILSAARRALSSGDQQTLKRAPKNVLKHLCFENGLRFSGRTKDVLISRLIQLVCSGLSKLLIITHFPGNSPAGHQLHTRKKANQPHEARLQRS